MKKVLISSCLLGTACRYDGRSVPCVEILAYIQKVQCIPICPEILGGLPTPRVPCERQGQRVISLQGVDTTVAYQKGARETLRLAKMFHCEAALLKEKSPSCGCGQIYDGSFSKKLIQGDGVATELLKKNGIAVFGESQLSEFVKWMEKSE